MEEKNIQQKTQALLVKCAETTGRPLLEITADYNKLVAEYKAGIPGKDEAYYEDLAYRKINLETRAEKNSQSKPYDLIILNTTEAIDVTKNDKEEKITLYKNEQTRAQAVLEGKVYESPRKEDGTIDLASPAIKWADKEHGIVLPDGTPLDTNEWMIKPNPEGKDKRAIDGVKNPNFGCPIKPLPTSNCIAIGRPAAGGPFKLAFIVQRNEASKLKPASKSKVRAKLILKEEGDCYMIFNAGKNTRYDPIDIPEFPGEVTDQAIYNFLEGAPQSIAPSLENLAAHIEANKNSKNKNVVFVADVDRIGDPTPNGSQLVILIDGSKADLEAEGVPMWVSKNETPMLTFGPQSKVAGVARASMGPGYNRETRSIDATIERPQLNCLAVFASPLFRVDPDEASPIAAEEGQ